MGHRDSLSYLILSCSEEEIFLSQSSFSGSLEPFTPDESHGKPRCLQLDAGDVVSNLFESNAAGRTNFLFEGHCAMTNDEEANEVQDNVVIMKKGKKRDIEAITDEEVAQRTRERINVLYVFTVKFKYVEGIMSRGICPGEYVEGNMSRGNIYCIVLLLLSAIVSAPLSPVTIKTTTNFSDS